MAAVRASSNFQVESNPGAELGSSYCDMSTAKCDIPPRNPRNKVLDSGESFVEAMLAQRRLTEPLEYCNGMVRRHIGKILLLTSSAVCLNHSSSRLAVSPLSRGLSVKM